MAKTLEFTELLENPKITFHVATTRVPITNRTSTPFTDGDNEFHNRIDVYLYWKGKRRKGIKKCVLTFHWVSCSSKTQNARERLLL